jgi:hypothetical protein
MGRRGKVAPLVKKCSVKSKERVVLRGGNPMIK